jgi:hypothetical protein
VSCSTLLDLAPLGLIRALPASRDCFAGLTGTGWGGYVNGLADQSNGEHKMKNRLLFIALSLPLLAYGGEPGGPPPLVDHPTGIAAQAGGKATVNDPNEQEADDAEQPAEDISAEMEEDQEIIKESAGDAGLKGPGGEADDQETKPAIKGVLDELKGGVEVIDEKPAAPHKPRPTGAPKVEPTGNPPAKTPPSATPGPNK